MIIKIRRISEKSRFSWRSRCGLLRCTVRQDVGKCKLSYHVGTLAPLFSVFERLIRGEIELQERLFSGYRLIELLININIALSRLIHGANRQFWFSKDARASDLDRLVKFLRLTDMILITRLEVRHYPISQNNVFELDAALH